uniref:CSON003852 protein n=1 Tax=Culicoides sonorensis TaxID=179676 RepID=A0A336MME2_CULSO
MFVRRAIFRRNLLQGLMRCSNGREQSTVPDNNPIDNKIIQEDELDNPKLVYRPQVKAELDSNLQQKLLEKKIHPRKHSGANQIKVTSLPDKITDTFLKVIGDHPVKKICKDAQFLENYLKSRHIPAEQYELRSRIKDIQMEVELKLNVDKSKLDDDEIERYKKVVDKQTEKLLKSRVFAWKALDYDEYRARMYLFARSVQEYAAIKAVFQEIRRRDPEFKPRSFLDFGSGVGTGTWAVTKFWSDSIYEYYNVDSSGHMNDLAELILKDGDENKQIPLKNVYYRQFLGAPNTSYDLVLSAFSLIELPNRKTRLETLANLWARTSGYLVLLELGTNTGFKLIHEARKFITSLNSEGDTQGYIFAPCPQESTCPRYATDEGTPCNFQIRYFPLPFYNIANPRNDRYSYIVFKKNGSRDQDPASNWPRLVRETLIKPRHVFCRMCTKDGNLQEVVFTAGKHGKPVYQCAKRSRWGDQLPLNLQTIEKIKKEDE